MPCRWAGISASTRANASAGAGERADHDVDGEVPADLDRRRSRRERQRVAAVLDPCQAGLRQLVTAGGLGPSDRDERAQREERRRPTPHAADDGRYAGRPAVPRSSASALRQPMLAASGSERSASQARE